MVTLTDGEMGILEQQAADGARALRILNQLIANGLEDMLTGHGYQYFSGGIKRLGKHGSQTTKSANPALGTKGFIADFWVADFSIEPGFLANRGYVDGYANTTETVMSVTAINGASPTDGTGGTVAAAFVSALATGEKYVLFRPMGLFDPLAADPTVLGDGGMWYRSDTDQFRGRRNGVTSNFLMTGDGGAAFAVTNQTGTYTAAVNDFVAASGTFTVTLPSAPAANSLIAVKNVGSGIITVARGGADTIYDFSSITSFTAMPGEEYTVIYDSTNTRWLVH